MPGVLLCPNGDGEARPLEPNADGVLPVADPPNMDDGAGPGVAPKGDADVVGFAPKGDDVALGADEEKGVEADIPNPEEEVDAGAGVVVLPKPDEEAPNGEAEVVVEVVGAGLPNPV